MIIIHLLFTLENYDYLVGLSDLYYFCLSFLLSITLESLIALVHHTATLHPLGRTPLVILRPHFIIFSILVTSLLTNPRSFDQYPIVLIFSIHNFQGCVIGIFSLVTTDDTICDSGILDNSLPDNHQVPQVSQDKKNGKNTPPLDSSDFSITAAVLWQLLITNPVFSCKTKLALFTRDTRKALQCVIWHQNTPEGASPLFKVLTLVHTKLFDIMPLYACTYVGN